MAAVKGTFHANHQTYTCHTWKKQVSFYTNCSHNNNRYFIYTESVPVGEDGIISSNLSNKHCNILTSLTTVELCLNSSMVYGCLDPLNNPYLELTYDNETHLIGLKSSVPLPNRTLVSVSCASRDCHHDTHHHTVIHNYHLHCSKGIKSKSIRESHNCKNSRTDLVWRSHTLSVGLVCVAS